MCINIKWPIYIKGSVHKQTKSHLKMTYKTNWQKQRQVTEMKGRVMQSIATQSCSVWKYDDFTSQMMNENMARWTAL